MPLSMLRKHIHTAAQADLYYVTLKINEKKGIYKAGFPDDSIAMILKLCNEPLVYRVKVQSSGSVEVLLLTMGDIDDPYCGVYSSAECLPQWMQDKIAVLSMLSEKPPTEDVPGIGRRIYSDVYWVYKE